MNRTLAWTLVDLTGAALIVVAAAMVWLPAGVAAAGGALLTISWRAQ